MTRELERFTSMELLKEVARRTGGHGYHILAQMLLEECEKLPSYSKNARGVNKPFWTLFNS